MPGKKEHDPFLYNYTTTQKANSRSCCCCQLSAKCCCISCCICIICTLVFLTLVLIVGYFVLKGMAESNPAGLEDSEKWERMLAGNSNSSRSNGSDAGATGMYELMSVSEGYDQYLDAIGIPFFIKPMLLNAKQILNVTVIKEGQNERWITNTTIVLSIGTTRKRDMEFVLGEEFKTPWGNNMGFMHNVCNRTKPNVLSCRSEERKREWLLTSEKTFSEGGVVDRREFVTKSMKYTKYFKRLAGNKQENVARILSEEQPDDPGSNPFAGDDEGLDDDFFEADDEDTSLDDFFGADDDEEENFDEW